MAASIGETTDFEWKERRRIRFFLYLRYVSVRVITQPVPNPPEYFLIKFFLDIFWRFFGAGVHSGGTLEHALSRSTINLVVQPQCQSKLADLQHRWH